MLVLFICLFGWLVGSCFVTLDRGAINPVIISLEKGDIWTREVGPCHPLSTIKSLLSYKLLMEFCSVVWLCLEQGAGGIKLITTERVYFK